MEPVKVAPKRVHLGTPVKELDLNRQLLTEGTVRDDKQIVQAKVKIKTRGISQPAEVAGGAQRANVAEGEIREAARDITEEHHPMFVLKARALKVFKTMFFDPSIDGTPGGVAWADFLYAMRAIGFAAEAIEGSEWHFHPATVEVKHGIVFHSPHPDSNMSFDVARRYGRNLRRAYGWEGHMFTLA